MKESIARHKQDYHYFEIWLEYLSAGASELTEELCRDQAEQMIFLFRRKNLEDIKMPLEQRKDLICLLAETEAYLDVDIFLR